MLANREKGRHLITTQIEHPAVLDTSRFLERLGFEVTYLPVDRDGMVNPDDVKAAIRPDTVLISVMFANNEVGTVQPVEAIGRIAREHGVYFHSDAVQALGTIPLPIGPLPVDMLSFSGHKIHGPKGVGLLYAGKDVKFYPHLTGGSQERKRRAGTENVAGIVGFARALSLSAEQMEDKRRHLLELRSRMLAVWDERLGGKYVVNGHPEYYLPHILNVSFPGADTETMLMNLDLHGIAASSGSACSAGSLERSHVLIAMGLPDEVINSAIRFSFGINTTIDEVERAAHVVAQSVERIRGKRRSAVK
jgi:cysteine desulfurase